MKIEIMWPESFYVVGLDGFYNKDILTYLQNISFNQTAERFWVNVELICQCFFISSILFRQAVTVILTVCQWDTSLRGNVASVIVRTYFLTSNSVQGYF